MDLYLMSTFLNVKFSRRICSSYQRIFVAHSLAYLSHFSIGMLVKSCNYDQAWGIPHSRQLLVRSIPLSSQGLVHRACEVCETANVKFSWVKCCKTVWVKFEWSVIVLKPLHIEMHVHTWNLNTACMCLWVSSWLVAQIHRIRNDKVDPIAMVWFSSFMVPQYVL